MVPRSFLSAFCLLIVLSNCHGQFMIQPPGFKRLVNVVTIASNPYVRYVKNHADEGLVGIDKFEGFCIDLLKEIDAKLQYFGDDSYSFNVNMVNDSRYGVKIDGVWRGMIGDVLSGKADIAMGDLTITSERESVVDFTIPFMKFGIGALAMKNGNPSIFSLVSPIPGQVWLCAFLSMVIVSASFAAISRLLSTEKASYLSDTGHSVWFVLSPIAQHSDHNVSSRLSMRALAFTWWSFAIIFLATYTAALSRYLMSEYMRPIQHIDELAEQTKLPYGMVRSGSTEGFFKNATSIPLQQMWYRTETSYPSTQVANTHEGVERVKRGDYVFLMESTSIEYLVDRDCDLYQIDGLFGWRGYGIAVSKNRSVLLGAFNFAIGQLKETGTLAKLKAKWWHEKDGAARCSQHYRDFYTLEASAFYGLFCILAAGIVISIVTAAIEVKIRKKQTKRHEPPVSLRLLEGKTPDNTGK